MAQVVIRSGLVGTADRGLDLVGYGASPRAYDPNGVGSVTVLNAAREDVTVEYSLRVGEREFHPLSANLPATTSLLSLVVAPESAKPDDRWLNWSQQLMFAAERRRPDGSSSPALRPALMLPDGSLVAATHLLQIVGPTLHALSARRHPKEDDAKLGDAVTIDLPGRLKLYAGPAAGPLEAIEIEGHAAFDLLAVGTTTRPDDPADVYPPG